MTFFDRICAFLVILTFFPVNGSAQNAAIGFWDSHLPYNTAVGVATDRQTIYTFCNQAFFTYNANDGQQVTYSKVDGMSDIGMQCGGYDKATNTLVLVYSSGSIDLFRNNSFYNIPDIKRINKPEHKKISQVYTENGFAYLSTTMGVVVIDLDKEEIAKTYKFQVDSETVPVNSFTSDGNYFYAVTRTGLYRGEKNNPMLQNTAAWTNLYKKDTFTAVATVEDKVFLSTKKKIYTVSGDSVFAVYTAPRNIQQISAGKEHLLIGVGDNSGGVMKVMDKSANVIDSFDCSDSTAQAVQLADNTIWVATPKRGLKKRSASGIVSIVPDGPSNPNAYDIYVNNKDLYIAHGGFNGSYFAANNRDGFSNYKDGTWKLYRSGSYPALDGRDYSYLAFDESTGTLYAGSYLNGLFIMHKDGSSEAVNHNSLFDGSVAYGADYHQVMGLTLDKRDNLWVTTMFSKHQLCVKAKDGTWSKYRVPDIDYGGGAVAVDDNGQVWLPGYHIDGLVVINTKNTVNDTSDDEVYHLLSGKGYGNLPGNGIGCVIKDLNNDIWVGTDNGIAIFKQCSVRAGSSGVCEAEVPVIQNGNHSGSLLEGEQVKTIAIDATGRKWVGTRNSGVWLISADAQTVIHHFTKDNSPVPSDYIQKIAIDKVTGDVYIGTDQGLVSYHSTATEGGQANVNVVAFPNPVRGDYTGVIAIRGLVAGADVRITDIAGHLVYKAYAEGGQVVWSGKDHTGRRPQSGVYLFFVTDKDGKQTYTGKIVFIQ
ncbi:MAG: Two component regulator propeller [Flavipsychrobacter sp.]|jgi:ligand-binding sensor domain-containing protein|nr:Two component regulator propeller [Flavipsychrobacter sp.]